MGGVREHFCRPLQPSGRDRLALGPQYWKQEGGFRLFDWDAEGNFYGGEAEPTPPAAPDERAVMKAWVTKAFFYSFLALAAIEIVLAITDAPCGAQVAATGVLGVVVGLLVPAADDYIHYRKG